MLRTGKARRAGFQPAGLGGIPAAQVFCGQGCPQNRQPGWLPYERTVRGKPPFVFRMHWDHEPDWHPSPCPLPAKAGRGRPKAGRGAVHGKRELGKEAGQFGEMFCVVRSLCNDQLKVRPGISIRHRSPRTTGRSIAAPCRRSWNWPKFGHRERKPVVESDLDDP